MRKFYGWWIVAASFISFGISVGLPYYNVPFFYDYFAKDFGWARSQITLGFPLAALLTLWVGPLLVPKLSPRKSIIIGTGLTALAFFGFSQMTGSLAVYYGLWFMYTMGYILSGQSCSHDLSIRKGRGRGYLFGHLHRADPWLSLDPTTFSGRATRIDVTVDTLTLPISQKPQAAQISIESSASEELLTVPVHFRVMGMPSGLNRYVIRPLLNILVAALIGGGLGLLLALFGVGTPGWLPAVLRLPEAIFWPVVVGLVWVIMAAVRGFLQPLAWPAFYTLGRWLLRTAIWGVTLIVVAAAALWLWRELETQLSAPAPIAWSSAIIAAFALAVLPGIGGELWNTRGASDPCAVSRRMPIWRPGLLVLSAVILCALLATGARLLAPSLQTNSASALVGRSEAWSSEQMSRLDVILNRAIDDFFLRLYDRRAPAPTATPVRTPRPAGTPAP